MSIALGDIGRSAPPVLESVNRSTETPSPLNENYQMVSMTLYAALPTHEAIRWMIKTGLDISFHQVMFSPYAKILDTPAKWKADLACIPEKNAHPVLLARYLLVFATCLQAAHPEELVEGAMIFSEQPHQLMSRLVKIAAHQVLEQDEYIGSLEGLECMILHARYECNNGNLQRAWFLCKRALTTAQMMGLPYNCTPQTIGTVDHQSFVSPSFIWFRLTWFDRHLCLMLGLPQTSLDTSEISLGFCDHLHVLDNLQIRLTVVLSRILEPKELPVDSNNDGGRELQEVDSELRRVADEMPKKWWLIPNLASVEGNRRDAFSETMRLIEQTFYFNVVNMLHLRYMLKPYTCDSIPGKSNCEYSKMTALNASRELLSRFIMFRSFNRVAYCCRIIDFFALAAAMTLILAHLIEYHKDRQQNLTDITSTSVLKHQRNGDRAILDQVLDNMRGIAKLNEDIVSQRNCSLLERLLAIVANIAEGKPSLEGQDNSPTAAPPLIERHPNFANNDERSFCIRIPYLGIAKISSDGAVSIGESPHVSKSADREDRVKLDVLHASKPWSQLTGDHWPSLETQQVFASGFTPPVDDILSRQIQYDGLDADVEEWMLQVADADLLGSFSDYGD